MMSKEGQEELITGLMERKKCARHEAMRVAVEERGFKWGKSKAQSTPGGSAIEPAVSTPGSAAIQRDFKNVFAMMGKERQEGLITGLMHRKKCTRHEAMRVAVEEWRHQR
jgi:hypothetical protein